MIFHLGYQQIAMWDQATGEALEKALSHERKEEVRAFYAGLEGPVRVGMEASGQSQWFERMLGELGHEVWIGDAAKIRASCQRKQKTDRRDAGLLVLLDQLEGSIGELDRAATEQANARPAARRLMTHPGVGPITALAFALTRGPAQRFRGGKQVASYLGLIPTEHSSGGRGQRLGHISRQGNPFLRGLLVEAAQSAVRDEPEMRRCDQRLAQRKCRALAKVAMARKLAVRLYWMLREEVDSAQWLQGSHAGQPESFCGRG